jgi:hypothetical protein
MLIVTIAPRTMAKVTIITSVIITGLRLYESLDGVGVVGVVVPVDEADDDEDDAGGFIFEAFLKIAASGELGDKPNSSVTNIFIHSYYVLVYHHQSEMLQIKFYQMKKSKPIKNY